MAIPRRRVLRPAAVALVLAMAAAWSVAWAQTGTIKIVVPFPPGGAIDVIARVMADGVGRI